MILKITLLIIAPGNCLNDETCNITTGKCHSGCKTGYKGGICDKDILNMS